MNRQNMHMHLATAVIAALALLGMAACGVSGSSGNANATSVPPTAMRSPTLAPSPTTTQVVTGGTIIQGQVTVTLDRATFAPSDTITVYVNNGLSASIQVADHQTACTIVTMQRSQGDSWQAVGPCRIMIVTRIKNLPAHTTTVVQLGPSAGQFAQTLWPAGTYRIALYYVSPAPERVSPVYSARFEIR